ncbi:hypothetical protein AB0J83_41515 [Actinoplanes sp. NPDC049596]|uniref:hypothetical protein n=1 Tax=unclassified Actinoplanes TaxID=2626549 RepID=UPI0034410AD7
MFPPKYGKQRLNRSEFHNLTQYTSLSDGSFRLLMMLNTLADDDGNVDIVEDDLFPRFMLRNDIPELIIELTRAGHIKPYEAEENGEIRKFASMVGWNVSRHPNQQSTHSTAVSEWRNPLPPWQDGPINATKRAPRTKKEISTDETTTPDVPRKRVRPSGSRPGQSGGVPDSAPGHAREGVPRRERGGVPTGKAFRRSSDSVRQRGRGDGGGTGPAADRGVLSGPEHPRTALEASKPKKALNPGATKRTAGKVAQRGSEGRQTGEPVINRDWNAALRKRAQEVGVQLKADKERLEQAKQEAMNHLDRYEDHHTTEDMSREQLDECFDAGCINFEEWEYARKSTK